MGVGAEAGAVTMQAQAEVTEVSLLVAAAVQVAEGEVAVEVAAVAHHRPTLDLL